MLVNKIIIEDCISNQTRLFSSDREAPNEFYINKNVKNSLYELLLTLVPGGVSIAEDVSCERITHNLRAAQFLRINAFESFSHSAVQPPPVKVFSNGKELLPNEMPIQQAAKNNRGIYEVELEFVWEDGLRKVALWNARPIHDEVGNVTENGTGLGLAVCYSIAHRHTATIDIQTCSNGTTFWVKFKKKWS